MRSMSLVWKTIPATESLISQDWIAEQSDQVSRTLTDQMDFLTAVWTRAPYLLDLSRKQPAFLGQLLEDGPDQLASDLLKTAAEPPAGDADESVISQQLCQAKARMALLCGVAEIAGHWPTEQVTKTLSDLADTALHTGLEYFIDQVRARGKLAEGGADITAANCGLAVFALGKHGGQELNYSSDIDIVALYDPSKPVLAEPAEASKTYSRIVQKLAGMMEDRSEHGYVFRTDLRLRPDPGSTPVALSVDAALTYYEARGQNWERAAWIKARACAGDKEVGTQFLKELAPFVWRKHLDFASIADIQAMKRQINIAKNVGGQRLAGHNVKLGRGGIREIEFFTQTQQLIAGGREPDLRVRPTVVALAALAAENWIEPKTAKELTQTYWFLRAVENRVQMQHDEQTHILPESEAELTKIAALVGYDDLAAFDADYRAALEQVTENYTNLFTDGESLSTTSGDLVFTGSDDDPGTLETLASMGFDEPSKAATIIRKWHYGGYAATRSSTARAHLTELLPVLLDTFAQAGNSDAALARFDNFLSRLPTGVQFFSILRSHTELCRLLVAFMSSAPKMAEAVIRRAHIVDGLIDPTRSDEVVDPEFLTEKLNSFLSQATSFEDLIDRARILGQEQMFLISAGLISGSISAQQAGRQYTVIADTLIQRLFEDARRQLAEKHGHIPGARVAVLGFGKLGSRDMSVSSDLDMILLYDLPDGAEESDGERPLAPSQYFTRLTQRLISAISAPTATGVLYEVDMRLRPSGNAGPVATNFSAFQSYQLERAWTWEHLALSRARIVCADDDFGEDIEEFLDGFFATERDADRVRRDVFDMRARLLKDRPARHPYDLKLADGGLMDMDFIAQSATLIYGRELVDARGDSAETLKRLAQMDQLPNGEQLAEYYNIMSGIIQVMSACLTDPFKQDAWTRAFETLLARLSNFPDFDRMGTELEMMRETTSSAFAEWIKTEE